MVDIDSTNPVEQEPATITGNAGQAAPALAPVPVARPASSDVIIGGELEAALRERLAESAIDTDGKYFAWRGDQFKMQPTLPAAVGLSAARMEESNSSAHIVRAIKQFFVPGEGERLLNSLTDAESDVPPDDKFLQDLLTTLVESYSQRPLVNAPSSPQ